MSLTDAQKEAATAPGSVAVLAGAGTGRRSYTTATCTTCTAD